MSASLATTAPSGRRSVPMADASALSWLSFRLAGQHYAAPLAQVSEVLRDGELTPVPGAADDVLGIRHLRGRIVPVMDGRRRLGLAAGNGADPTQARVVVLVEQGQLIGLRVDAIGDLLTPSSTDLAPAPAGRGPRQDDAVQGVVPLGEGFVALLDVRRLCRLPDAA
jgi:purine-binding chemotaxis protein CheW